MPRRIATAFFAVLLAGCSPALPPTTPRLASSTASSPPAALPSASPDATPTSSPFAQQAPSAGAPSSAPATTRPPAAPPAPGPEPSPTALDEWVSAGSFATFREDTQLALLGDGKVLAAGSEPTCGVESDASSSAEVWSPRTSAWKVTDEVPSARTRTQLAALADGRAIIAGGANQQYVAKSSTAVYDPARRRWSVSGLLNTARMEFAMAALPDGRVLVAGGLLIRRDQSGEALRSAEIWSSRRGTWSKVAPLSTVRLGASAVTLADGRVLVVGGLPEWGADRPLATAEIFNPRTGRWRTAGSLTAPRLGFSLVAVPSGGALVVGGQAGEDRAELFDPVSRTWSQVRGAAPHGVRPAAVPLADGQVLVVSGRTAMRFDPATSRWQATARLPHGMWDAAAVLLADGTVLLGGGWTQAARPDEAPGCPTYDNRTWRFIPGS